MPEFTSALDTLREGVALGEREMQDAMTAIMDARVAPEDVAEFLTMLARRGETVDEIVGAARSLRQKALTITAPPDAVDCCGTGGDGARTLNVSTAVALIAAACGVPVAKHGNRASSSKSGSADVLEALGINIDIPPERAEEALRRFNFAFLMAPRHHQAMRNVREIRKSLGFRTVFNILGPLANPAGTRRQLIGIYDGTLLQPVAEALARLGTERAWVVHGRDGLDEITLTGETDIALLQNGKVSRTRIGPDDFGLPVHEPGSIAGDDAAYNARALQRLLEGEKSAYRDFVLANTAAVLLIHGTAGALRDGVERAAAAIDSGAALKLVDSYRLFAEE